MVNAAIVIASGYTDAEFLVAYHWLKAFDVNVTVYSPEGGPVRGIMGWTHPESISLPGHVGTGSYQELLFNDVLVLIGGVKAIEKLRLHGTLIRAVAEFDAIRGKLIASICHGAQLLIEADIVRGRTLTGYYSIKRDILNAGGVWDDGPVVQDGELISSPHYNHAGIWMRRVHEALNPL